VINLPRAFVKNIRRRRSYKNYYSILRVGALVLLVRFHLTILWRVSWTEPSQPYLESERTGVALCARCTNFVKGTIVALVAITAVHFHSVVVITHIFFTSIVLVIQLSHYALSLWIFFLSAIPRSHTCVHGQQLRPDEAGNTEQGCCPCVLFRELASCPFVEGKAY
jgi:hypothetical protein